MSEPLGVEERARLRKYWEKYNGHRLAAIDLLDEVDRLTEALEEMTHRCAAAEGSRDMLLGSARDRLARAERAEADLADMRERAALFDVKWAETEEALADEKRRHAGLRAGVEALADHYDMACAPKTADRLRALLDTATGEWYDTHDAITGEYIQPGVEE